MEDLYKRYEDDNDPEIADELLELLLAAKRAKWEKSTSEMCFKHSSRKSWTLLRKLGEAANPAKIDFSIHPNEIASIIQHNSTRIKGNKRTSRKVKSEVRRIKAILQENEENDELARPFTIEDLDMAISAMKTGKAAGLDGIYPEFIRNLGKRARLWLLKLLNKITKTANLPALLMKTIIVAILKYGKDPALPESYRPIALLSVIYKLLERLIIVRIHPLINESLPPEFAGFRENRSCTEQVLALTSYIEAGFEKQCKTAAVFVDLSVAYETVWRLAFMMKFLKAVRSKRLGCLVNSMLSNRYVRVSMSGVSSKQKRLKNGFAQGGVASPDYFNLYISDMPNTISRKFPFADDLALCTQTELVEFNEAEEALTEDMKIMVEYYEKWRLCLNMEKTECCMFHLNNHMANVELQIRVNNEIIRYNKQPKYLGNELDRGLTYKPLVENRCKKLKSRNNIVQKISGTDWGANAHTLRTTALSLVYSTAEYAAPVWYQSAHSGKIDVQLNETMRIITGAVDSTPVPWLHVLSNIAPPHLRRENAAHREWIKIMEHPSLSETQIRDDFLNPPPHRLTSRHPIWKDHIIQNRNFSLKERWKEYWESSPDFQNKTIINNPYDPVHGFRLPRREWKTLNRFRTGHGCCAEKMFLWNFADSPVCDCDGTTVQSMRHIVNDCPLRRFNGEFSDLHSATTDAIEWIKNLDLNI